MTIRTTDGTTYAVVEVDHGNRLRRVVGSKMTLPTARRKRNDPFSAGNRRVWCGDCLADATRRCEDARDDW